MATKPRPIALRLRKRKAPSPASNCGVSLVIQPVQVHVKLLHGYLSYRLAEPLRCDYIISRKLKGSVHWLESAILLVTSVKPGSSVSPRLRKSPNRSESARRASILGRTITLDREMQI